VIPISATIAIFFLIKIFLKSNQMKTNNTFRIAFLFMVTFYSVTPFAKAQYIVAGMYSTDDIYVDIDPDSMQEAVASHWWFESDYEFPIDLDSNGIDDVSFISGGGGGLAQGSAGGTIHKLHSNVEFIAYYDTFVVCCPMDVVTLVADSLNMGDTISSEDNFFESNAEIWSDAYGPSTTPIIENWEDIGIHFIGFRLCYSFDTSYGWIKINVIADTTTKMYIMEYACNRNASSGISSLNPPQYSIYPNPFFNELYVNVLPSSGVRLTIYDAAGKKIIEKSIQGFATIKTDFLFQGIYFYELVGSSGVVRRGKLIRKQTAK
jgi:hypothetical protein